MRYLVTGGAGFVASHIVDELIERGNDVLVVDNLVSGSMDNINPKADFVFLDITDDKGKLVNLMMRERIDYVFHLAAEPFIPDCYDHPERFFEVNATGTMNVLIASNIAKVRKIVYFSTSEVYGTVEGRISEDTRLNPQSTYAVSKLAGDRLCLTLFKEQGIPVVILRQFNCYGPRETHDYIIPTIISQLTRGQYLSLGNINSKRDFTYVKDAAKTACDLMDKGTPGQVYNSGTGKALSIEEIAYKIGKAMGVSPIITIDKKKLRPFDVEKLECDNSKILKFLPDNYKIPFDEGIGKTIDWFYQNGKRWGFE